MTFKISRKKISLNFCCENGKAKFWLKYFRENFGEKNSAKIKIVYRKLVEFSDLIAQYLKFYYFISIIALPLL